MNNYHTHTFRCNHAIGTEIQFVEEAIKEGYDAIGFSDHVPLPNFRWHLCQALPFALHSFRDILSWGKSFLLNGPGMRMKYTQKKAYLCEIERLKKIYNGKINIYSGFECEYLIAYLPYYRKMLESNEVDYLILGHHFHHYSVSSQYYGRRDIQKQDVINYVDEAIEAMQTGIFKYFAHPDLIFIGYHQWDQFIEDQVKRMLETAKKYHVVLEINAGGLRRKKVNFDGKMDYPYPRIQFWQIAKELDCEVIIGLDAHDPSHLDHHMYQKLEAWAKQIGFDITKKSARNNFRGS